MTDVKLSPTSDLVHDRSGIPRFGTYEGSFDHVDLSRLGGEHALNRVQRLLRHKKWAYTFAAGEEVAVMCAVVDAGYTTSGFALVADMREGTILADRSYLGSPPPLVAVGDDPAVGLAARYASPGGSISVSRPRESDAYQLRLDLRPPGVGPLRLGSGAHVQVSLDMAAADERPISVVAPVADGGVNVTMKTAALPTSGSVRVGERTYRIDGGVGGIDYTNGHLARHTAWRWAFAAGRTSGGDTVALNLVEGFNEARAGVNENALWLGGRLVPLDRARFTFDADHPEKPWEVRTVDDAVQLQFRAFGVHDERRNLGVVRSKFVQPVGVFEGTIRVGSKVHEVVGLPGVTEDQDILW